MLSAAAAAAREQRDIMMDILTGSALS